MKTIMLATTLLAGACVNEENLGSSSRTPVTHYTTLATGSPGTLWDVAVDHDYVYWIASGPGAGDGDAIYRVPKLGGDSEVVGAITSGSRAYDLIADDDALYAADNGGGRIVRVAKADGSLTVVDRYTTGVGVTKRVIGVDASFVYTSVETQDTETTPATFQLWKHPKTGGAGELYIDDARASRLQFFGSSVFSMDPSDTSLWMAPRDGGVAPQPFDGITTDSIVGDDTAVFFVNGAGKAGVPDQTCRGQVAMFDGAMLSSLGDTASCGMIRGLSSQAVYVVEPTNPHGDGTIVAFDRVHAARVELVTNLMSPNAVTAEPDGSAIYWVDFLDGTVNRLDLFTLD